MKCPKCNEEIKDGSTSCSNCGNKIEEITEEKKDSKWGLVLGCSAILSALVVLCIKTELAPGKFFATYFLVFVVVFLCLSIIYLIFKK